LASCQFSDDVKLYVKIVDGVRVVQLQQDVDVLIDGLLGGNCQSL